LWKERERLLSLTRLKINIRNCDEMVERMESREDVEVACSGRENFEV
jgi:hypothetical protein